MNTTSVNGIKLVYFVISLLILTACNDQSAKDSLAIAKEKGYINYEVLKDSVIYHYIYRSGINWYKGEAASFKVKDADPKTFIELTKSYAKDSLHVYHKGHKLKKRDVISFKIIDDFITSDKYGVYVKNKVIKNSEGLSFKLLNERYAIDKNQVYYFLATQYEVLKSVDRKTFVPIDNSYDYAKDINHVYYRNHLIKSAKPNSFEILGYDYAKDNKHVYYKNTMIKEVDYATFHVLERDSIIFKKAPEVTVFAEDKVFYYRDTKAIKK